MAFANRNRKTQIMKTTRLPTVVFLSPLALLLAGCPPPDPRAPAAPSPSPAALTATAGSQGLECTLERLKGSYSGSSTGNLLLSLGEKPLLSRQLTGAQAATVEDRQGQLVLRLGAPPAVDCQINVKCTSPSFAQMDFDQQCVFNFSSLSPAHTEDVVFELLKGEASIGGATMDLRLEWKAKSRRAYDRSTGRLSIDLAVGTMEQNLKLTRR